MQKIIQPFYFVHSIPLSCIFFYILLAFMFYWLLTSMYKTMTEKVFIKYSLLKLKIANARNDLLSNKSLKITLRGKNKYYIAKFKCQEVKTKIGIRTKKRFIFF